MEILIGIILSLLFIYGFIFFICYKILVPIMDAIDRFFEKIFSPLMGKLAEKRLKKTTSNWIARKNEEEKEFYKKEIEPYPLRVKYYNRFKREIEDLIFYTNIGDIGYGDKLLDKKEFVDRLDDFIQFYQNNVEAYILRNKYYDQYYQDLSRFLNFKSIVSTIRSERLDFLKGLDDYIKLISQTNIIQSTPSITPISSSIPSTLTVPTNTFDIEKDTAYSLSLNHFLHIRFEDLRRVAADRIRVLGGGMPPNHGVTPLSTEKDLLQYMYSYGNMHYAKLKSALNYLPVNLFQEKIEIIDWGCGQAIATITLLELKKPQKVTYTLIEPSLIALKRATLHTKFFHDTYSTGVFSCKTLNKDFDSLYDSDVKTSSSSVKIHLFSNTLDIEGRYSQLDLVNLIKHTQSGKNYFVCCSPYINFEKRQKIDNFVNEFRRMSNFRLYCSVDNSMDDDWWECNRHFKGYSLCRDKDCEDCNEKWTRIIRVFSVEL